MKIIRVRWILSAVLFLGALSPLAGQQRSLDPAEPPRGKPVTNPIPPPAGAIALKSVDKAALRATIEELVGCGTRSSISSWTDPKRGIGCARDHIVARFNEIAKESGGRMGVKVDGFD